MVGCVKTFATRVPSKLFKSKVLHEGKRFASINAAAAPHARTWKWLGSSVAGGTIAGSGVYFWKAAENEFRTMSDEGLPQTFDMDAINRFWEKHPTVVIRRVAQIIFSVLPLAGKVCFDYYSGKEIDLERKRTRAIELRLLLTTLGPAFIKFGQMLATRPDLLPQVALTELQKLCDAVPSFPTPQAMDIIKAELGENVLSQFIDLNETSRPFAAASLGQVYCVRLKESGMKVAVKVQRPDMARTVSLDLFILRRYGQCLEAVKGIMMNFGILSRRRQFDVELMETFARGSFLELDYCNEGLNQERFLKDLVPKLKNQIRVPRVQWSLTSKKVLTTEWIEGKQLINCNPQTIKKLVPVGVECFLMQLLELGYFHSDPHPGNLLVDEQERLCLIDFGLCATVPLPDTKYMTDAIVHIMEGDVPGLLEDAIHLGFLEPDVDKENLLVALERVFQISHLNVSSHSSEMKFQSVSNELNSVFYEYPFLVPAYFALVTRALIVLEGIAKTGDSKFDIFQAAFPYAKRRTLRVMQANDVWRIISSTFKLSQSSITQIQ